VIRRAAAKNANYSPVTSTSTIASSFLALENTSHVATDFPELIALNSI